MAIRSISCFTGCGGLDLAVELALPGIEPLLYLENELKAAEILVSRIKEGSLKPAHVWSDITTFDASQLRGKVDIVIGGFPCPDYSVAGRRAGIGGKHGQLWNAMRETIRLVEPGWVFLENVPGITNPHKIKRWRCIGHDLFGRTIWSQYRVPAGIGFVLGDLAEMGFDIQWGCLPASAVGASHKRERWFALAYRAGRGIRELRESCWGNGFTDGRGADVADSGCERRQQITRGAYGDEGADEGRAANSANELASGFGHVEDTTRHERNGSCWESGRRRGVCETSGAVVNPRRTEGWPHLDGGGNGKSRRDGEGEAAGGAGERGEVLGDSECARWAAAGSGSALDARSESEPGCGELGNPIGTGLEIGRCERGDDGPERAPAERAGEPLEHADEIGCGESLRRAEVDGTAGSGRDADLGYAPEESGFSLGIFAPGPSDPRWPDLLVRCPWLRPAISQAEAERALRFAPDGVADLVVRDRTDALRAIGNGVVPLQAAAMFRKLLRRIP